MTNTMTATQQWFAHINRLAGIFYQIGNAIRNDNEEVKVLLEQSQEFLIQLTQSPRVRWLQRHFDLDEYATKLLLTTYCFEAEPETLGPYLQQSWYEQGPFPTLDKLLFLASPEQYSQRIKRGLNTDHPIWQWQLLIQQNEELILVGNTRLAPNVFAFLSSQSIKLPTRIVVEPLSQDLAVQQAYGNQLSAKFSPLTILHAVHETHALVLVQQKALQNRGVCGQYVSDEQETSESLNALFRDWWLYVGSHGNGNTKQPCYLYWPEFLKLSQQTELQKSLQQNLALDNHYLVTADEGNEPPIPNQWSIETSQVTLTRPNIATLALAWAAVLQSLQQDHITALELERLALLYPIPVTVIQALVIRTKARLQSLNYRDLQSACLNYQQDETGELASQHQPRFRSRDMVLNVDTREQLEELIARVMYKDKLSETFNSFTAGSQALFWGQPGTGKSMAAEAIAGELQLPLYKVNLANVASKWIGESEKHLAKLFDVAERQHAVLLFDEADAIFAKRSEVESSHDKNANMGVSFLLQRMESYTGLLLLSTNFKNNIDEAFLRRFHMVLEFPMPNNTQRLDLWQQALAQVNHQFSDATLEQLAELFEFSPAQIYNSAERAVLFQLMDKASQITRQHLALAIKRELDKQSAGYLAQKQLEQWQGQEN